MAIQARQRTNSAQNAKNSHRITAAVQNVGHYGTQIHQPAAAAGPAAPQFARFELTAMASGEHFCLPIGLQQWFPQGCASLSEATDSRPPANEKRIPPWPCYHLGEWLPPDTCKQGHKGERSDYLSRLHNVTGYPVADGLAGRCSVREIWVKRDPCRIQ